MPRKALDAIIDPVRRMPIDEKRGTAADRLQKVIINAVSPYDVAFGDRVYVRKAAGGRDGGRVRSSALDVRKPFKCRLMGCDVHGTVEWDIPDTTVRPRMNLRSTSMTTTMATPTSTSRSVAMVSRGTFKTSRTSAFQSCVPRAANKQSARARPRYRSAGGEAHRDVQ